MHNGQDAQTAMRQSVRWALSSRSPDDIVAWWGGEPISLATLLARASQLQGRLPPSRFILNLCEDRYLFLVTFVAALMGGQISLLPPNRSEGVLEDIGVDYADSCRVTDADVRGAGVREGAQAPCVSGQTETFEERHAEGGEACHIFTSGSTGRPRAHSKAWTELVHGSRLLQQRFGLGAKYPHASVVATVPPQHMYGFETTVLLPLLAPVTVYGGRPFFADDVRRALESMEAPRVLVTTPVHLRSCVEAGLSWPEVDVIISATAPLAADLARRGEAQFGCPVQEIYGSTETGSVATRRTAQQEMWRLYERITLEPREDGVYLHGPQVADAVRLNDRIELLEEAEFRLLGRDDDLVNIAGKRGSLGDLTRRLQAIPGVRDGLFFLPSRQTGAVERLCAFVVAPELEPQAILRALARQTDPVFLPRPLCMVEALPRDDTGKVPRRALEALLQCRGA